MSISQLNVRYVFHFHLNFSTVAMKHKFLLPSPYCWVLVTTIFVPVYVNSFHLNVTGGQFRPFVWSKPVVICSAETSSVEDIITITIIFQTTAFARTCTVFVDFVVLNFRGSNYVPLKQANISSHILLYGWMIAETITHF